MSNSLLNRQVILNHPHSNKGRIGTITEIDQNVNGKYLYRIDFSTSHGDYHWLALTEFEFVNDPVQSTELMMNEFLGVAQ